MLKGLKAVAVMAAVGVMAVPGLAGAAEVRPGVTYAGTPEAAGSARAALQDLVFEVATAWADCNTDAMAKAVAETINFSYPTSTVVGRDNVLADLAAFCGSAKDTNIYFPADAFYIDVENGRVAAEVQFATFQRGNRQVVNDVWIATVKDGQVTVLKEYLDGRVKDLQALGVLQLDEAPAALSPWPPRTEAWADCFPLVKAAPTNVCPAP